MPLLLLTQRSKSVRQTSSSYYTTLQPYCRPQASSSRRQYHVREAVHPWCIRAYNPSPRIGRAAGADAYTPTTAPTITNRHEQKKLTILSLRRVLVSVVKAAVVLAAAACDSVVTTRACCHRLPISVSDHHHAASLLFFLSGSTAGIVIGMLLPIPF